MIFLNKNIFLLLTLTTILIFLVPLNDYSLSETENSNNTIVNNHDTDNIGGKLASTEGTAAYDESGWTSLLSGYYSYSSYYVSSEVTIWVETDDPLETIDLLILDQANYDQFVGGYLFLSLASSYNAHVDSINYNPSVLTLVYLVYRNDGLTSVGFNYIIDLGVSEFPYFSGHTIDTNGHSLDPNFYYYITGDYGPGDQLTGYFEHYMPSGDSIDFFICDYNTYWDDWRVNWDIPSGAYVVRDNYIYASWSFVPPYQDTWYIVHSNVDGFDTVTFSLYMQRTDIPASIVTTSPTSSSSWDAGTGQFIAWSTTGDITDVKLELYYQSAFYSTIAASTTNDGSYFWGIPSDTPGGSQYQVKITDTSDASVYDYSDIFTIVSTLPTITITSPTSSSEWDIDTVHTISWTWTDTVDYVDIYLGKAAAFLGYIEQNVPNSGSYSWTVLDGLTPDSDYWIYIEDSDNIDVVYDYSDYFTINEVVVGDTIVVTYPIGGSSLETGQTCDITWTWDGDITNVVIGLVKDEDGVGFISEQTSNDGSFTWIIPVSLVTGSDYWIYVRDYDTYDTIGVTDYFTITQVAVSESITISTPSSDTVWSAGTINTIRWTTTGEIDDVNIYIAKGEEVLGYIALAIDNIGSYDWGIPDDMSNGDDYWIIIDDEANDDNMGFSPYFEILEKVTEDAIFFTSPSPVSTWKVGGTYNIDFFYLGETLTEVIIELYKAGSFYLDIDSFADGDSPYKWTIPDVPAGNDYQIKVTLYSNHDLWGISDEFRIEEASDTSKTSEESDTGPTFSPGFTFPLILMSVGLFAFYRNKSKK